MEAALRRPFMHRLPEWRTLFLRQTEGFFVRHATVIAMMAVTFLMIADGFIFYRIQESNRNARAWVLHSREVKERAESLLAKMGDAELSHGAYLMTGDETILARYKSLVPDLAAQQANETSPDTLPGEIEILRQLTTDNPAQQKNLVDVAASLQKLLDFLASTLNDAKAGKTKIGTAAIDFQAREMLMRSVHANLKTMMDEENGLLLEREQAERIGRTYTNYFLIAGMAVFYLLVMVSIRLCQKAEKIAQASLSDSEQRNSLALRGLSVGLWDWNVATGQIYWSPRFREIMGIAGQDFAPTLEYVEENLHPEDRESIMSQLHGHVRSKGQTPYDNECRLRRPDGSYAWLHSRGQGMWDKKGNPIRMVGSVEDITARKDTEHEIEHHMKALRQSNQELDDFAYIASHDLKEPLRGLTNNAMFLKEDIGEKLDEKTTGRLDRMMFLCQRLERLVDDLLYFSRLGRQELAIQPTDLNEVIKDIKLTMETSLREANAVIVTPEKLPTIICDLPRVTEVFRNLITNAMKYNKNAEKRIEIGCADMKATAGNDNTGRAFYVRDNGIGIPPQFYSDIFRIFKRLNEEDEKIKGTGVGLTFVRKIVERHGGRIWLDSEVGKGTTFYFTLNTKKEIAS